MHERSVRAAGADARCARAAHAGAARSRIEPAAGGDRSRRRLAVDVTEGRVLQFGLFARALPTDTLATLARAARRAHGQRSHRRAVARRHLSSRRLRDGDIRSAAQLYDSPIPNPQSLIVSAVSVLRRFEVANSSARHARAGPPVARDDRSPRVQRRPRRALRRPMALVRRLVEAGRVEL